MVHLTALLLALVPALASALPPQLVLQQPSPGPLPHSGEEILRLHWAQRPDAALTDSLNARYDVLRASGDHLDLRLRTDERNGLEALVGGAGEFETLHTDVSSLLTQQSSVGLPDDSWDSYHNLAAVESLLRLFAADHPKHAELVEVGMSAENRTILGLRVGTPLKAKASKKGKKDKKKKKKKPRKVGMLIVGGQHAREWISTASTLFMAHSLLLQADDAPKKLRRLLETYDFTFVPTLNPDGYEYSWSVDRLWRKNRQPVGKEEGCFGIDLNRNWGAHWSPDSYENPCADSYPGSEAFEAIEIRALRDFISRSPHKIVSVLDLHSFGQMLMFPYSWSCDKEPPHIEDLTEAAYGGVRAASLAHGLTWEVGRVCEVSYTSSGQLVDYAYSKAKIKWSFSANLRDAGVHGFLLPANQVRLVLKMSDHPIDGAQIRASGEETLAMMLAIADFVRVKEKL